MTYRESLRHDATTNHLEGHLSDTEAKTLHGIIDTANSIAEFRDATILKRAVIGWSHPNQPVHADVVAPKHCPVVSVFPVDTQSASK